MQERDWKKNDPITIITKNSLFNVATPCVFIVFRGQRLVE